MATTRLLIEFKQETGRMKMDMDTSMPIPEVLCLRFAREWTEVGQELRDCLDGFFDDLAFSQGVRSQYFVDMGLMAWIIEGLTHTELGNLLAILTSFTGQESGDWDILPSRLDVGELLYWNEFEHEYLLQGVRPSYEQYHREMLWPDVIGWLQERNAAATAHLPGLAGVPGASNED